MDISSRECVPKLGGEKPTSGCQGSVALLVQRSAGSILARPGFSPHPCAGIASRALPTAVVQVQQEGVVPKFLEGLVMVSVHVACGGATNLPSGDGPGDGSRDTQHTPGALLKPRDWGKELGAPLECLSGGHSHSGDPSTPPGPFSSPQPYGGTTAANGAEVMAKAWLDSRGQGDGKLSKSVDGGGTVQGGKSRYREQESQH